MYLLPGTIIFKLTCWREATFEIWGRMG